MSTETEQQANQSERVSPSPSEPSALDGKPTESAAAGLVHRALGLARRTDWRIVSVLLLAAISIPVWRAIKTNATIQPARLPVLPVVRVPVGQITREDLYTEVTIPAEFRPYEEVELHAKVS